MSHSLSLYSHRQHAFASERTYSVEPEALAWHDAKGKGWLAYADLAEVRLAYAPTRVQENRFLLSLKDVGGKSLHIGNESWRGLADFEDRSLAFRDFALALHRAVAEANPGVRFAAGNTGGRHALNWLMAMFVAGVIVAALVFFVAFGLVWIALLKIGLIAWYLPTLKRYLTRNKPRSYDPASIPSDMLPSMLGRSV